MLNLVQHLDSILKIFVLKNTFIFWVKSFVRIIFSAFGRRTFHPCQQDRVFGCDLNKA